ncbi:MAG TPA: alpha/beta hydrolase [Candidatus Binataceae bacterium]|nr:alpha/beta hydrolase [Candidatus Binataceae bacterium]
MDLAEHEFTFDGARVHYLEAGRGFPILLIHGSGPGASTIGNWRLVLEPLAARFHVFAMDLIGFGRSERKPKPPYFDLDLWLRQCRAMVERIEGERVGLIGHSLSGVLALKLAAAGSRVAKVLTTGTMGAPFTPNDQTLRTWTFPRDRAELRRTAEGLVYNKSLIDAAYLDNREKVLFAGDYAAYFSSMFEGDRQRYIDAAVLQPDELARIHCDVTMLHGRDDVGFPPELTLTIAKSIPQADVVLIGRCSHSIAMEHPSKLIASAELLFR